MEQEEEKLALESIFGEAFRRGEEVRKAPPAIPSQHAQGGTPVLGLFIFRFLGRKIGLSFCLMSIVFCLNENKAV